MGLFTTSPVIAGDRFRDDYGATHMAVTSYTSFRTLRNVSVAQSLQVVTPGDLNNAK